MLIKLNFIHFYKYFSLNPLPLTSVTSFTDINDFLSQFKAISFILGISFDDTMQYIKPDVSTICIGMAASMGAFLLNAGAKGKRFALPNSEIMIHQPLGGAKGQATDIEIHAKWILKIKERLNKILSERTGQPIEKIQEDTERDNFMSAQEAKEYGLIDEVIEKK